MLQEIKPDLILQEITDDQHISLGGSGVPIQEDGQWLKYLPSEEVQAKRIETSNCTGFATLNGIEILLLRSFGLVSNLCDRFLGIVAGTTSQGNDPHVVCEAVRKFGCIDEQELPFDESIDSPDKYYSPKPVPGRLIALGNKWRDIYTFKHQWVLTGKPDKEKLLEELKYSPLGIGIFAWYNEGDIYKRYQNRKDNHWTLLVGYKLNEYWLVYDSYSPFIKKIDWDYDIRIAKKFILTNAITETQLTIIEVAKKVIELFRQLIKQKLGLWKN